LPFKLNHGRRHHIPRQRRKVVNWRDYDAGLRRRGSLTVWFTAEAIEGWNCREIGGQAAMRWSLEFGQGDKLGSPFGEDGPDGGEADAVLG